MKIKARDIVAGWPRGRSTSSSTFAWSPLEVQFFRRRLAHLTRGELLLEYSYHRRQQLMVDAFLAAWRTMPPSDPLDFNYFPSELRTFPVFMESLETRSLEEIVGHYAREPIIIARSF